MGLFRNSKRDLLLKDILNKRGESLSGDQPKSSDTKKHLSMVVIIFVMFVIVVAGTGFMLSPAGQRTAATAFANFREVTLDPVSDFTSDIFSFGAGDYFDYSTNSSSEKMGIDLEDFRMVTGDTMPAGYPMDFLYEIEYINVPRDSTYDAEFTCYFNITKKDGHVLEIPEQIFGEILPSSKQTIRRDSQSVCRFSGDDTEGLNDAYVFYGSFAFDYATNDVTIPVYFISGELSDSLVDQDFFDKYGLDVSTSDLKTTYNGEPLSIAIDVDGEGSADQPVVVRSGDIISYNTIGISIKNVWNGDLLELYDFKLSLPDGIELNDQLNVEPSPSCPFVFTGVENRYNTYKLDDSMIDFFDAHIAKSEFFGTKDHNNFQCWLDIDPEILSNAPYTLKEYKAEARYKYKIDEKSDTITITSAGTSLIVGSEGVQ